MFLCYRFEDDNLFLDVQERSLDAKNAPEFKETLLQLTQKFHYPYLYMDLKMLEFIDSAGLASLISILKLLASHKKDCFLVGLKPSVEKIFLTIGLEKIFPNYPSFQEALATKEKRSCEAIFMRAESAKI